jgi:hypothetical protein
MGSEREGGTAGPSGAGRTRGHDAPVCVVGAGPSGLALGAALEGRGVPFEILDAGDRVGGIWDVHRTETPMYASAHFITSRTLSGFPGVPLPDHLPDYPRHDQVLDYLEAFARDRGLHERVRLGARVVRARRLAGGKGWEVTTAGGTPRRYGALCAATGATWFPRIPELPGSFDGEAYHVFHYRSAEEIRGRRVLVVGAGNSGCDIACDAARVAKRACLSLRRGYHVIPKYVFGMPADVFARRGPRLPAWLERRILGFLVEKVVVGDLERFGLPAPDHPILASHPIVNDRILGHLGHGRLEIRPDVRALAGKRVVFEDGREETFDVVLWATGYERRFPFLERVPPGDGATPGQGAGNASDVAGPRGIRPDDLYLALFHRREPTLFFPGLFETDGPAFELLGLQAGLVAAYLAHRRRGGKGAAGLDARRRSARRDLRGGRRYLESRRHRWYVHHGTYRRALRREARRLGWAAPGLELGG